MASISASSSSMADSSSSFIVVTYLGLKPFALTSGKKWFLLELRFYPDYGDSRHCMVIAASAPFPSEVANTTKAWELFES